MRGQLFALFMLASSNLLATEQWQFNDKIAVTDTASTGVFHHLEGAGRKHIAVSGEKIALSWEDDSSGAPQVYLAHKNIHQNAFSAPVQLSDGDEAYLPAIAAVSNERFISAYEQDGQVYARLWSARSSPGSALKLSRSNATQPSIATDADNIVVVWREKQSLGYQLRVAQLVANGDGLAIKHEIRSIEPNSVESPLLMPGISLAENSICVAWEDRRAGHTRILYSYAQLPDLQFSEPESLNEYLSNRNEYDKGNGVTRVTLASRGDGEIVATWMDKRRGGKGYGIFAALGDEAGASFGPNEKVHSAAGDEQPHYNPAVAANGQGDFVIAWDDFRQGDLDIWLSNYNDDEEWTEDYAPELASGVGEQSHASVALDADGGLHLFWVEREHSLAPTRLWYSYATENH